MPSEEKDLDRGGPGQSKFDPGEGQGDPAKPLAPKGAPKDRVPATRESPSEGPRAPESTREDG